MPNSNEMTVNVPATQQAPSALLLGEAIAVIGIGCWYPDARNPVQLWENILARRRAFRRMPDERLPLADYYDPDPLAPEKTYGQRAALIDGFAFDWVGRRFPQRTYESTDIAQWLALEVAIAALDDAGYNRETALRDRTAVIVGNTLTGEQTRSNSMRLRWPYVRRALLTAAAVEGVAEELQTALATTMEELYKSAFPPITEDTLAGGLANTIAGRICNYFDFHGGGYNVDGACSSSLLAVCTAANHLALGDADMVVAGGVDISLDAFELVGFAKTGALTANGMHVYGKNAQGFLPGEGAGFVVMKRLADARAAGDKVYAVVRGWGISSDGKGGITRPSSSGQAAAILRSYQRAGYGPDTLDFVEGHGTGTPVGDKIELTALAAAIHETNPTAAPRICGMTSLKSIIGHTKAAAGVGAFIKAVMAANRRVIPPTAGMEQATDVFDAAAQSLYPVQYGAVVGASRKLRVGVSAMGFGGINSHVTLESGDLPLAELMPSLDERALLVSNQQSELFVFGAPTVAELLDQLEQLQPVALDISEAELVDLANAISPHLPPNPQLRAAIVAQSPEQLVQRLGELQQLLQATPPVAGEFLANPTQTVWVGNGVQKQRLGFLFPGQGSQQLAMARTLVERHGWARELVAKADGWIREAGGTPVADLIFRPLDRADNAAQIDAWLQALAQTEIAQPAICLASLIYAQHLAHLGLRPAVVGGHSLGELTAFYLAGVFDAETLIKLATYRGKAMMATDERPGTMAVLLCTRAEATALLAQATGYVVVANHNSPRQVVISGEVSAIEGVIALAEAQAIRAIRIAVSNAFHSDLVAPAAATIQQCPVLPDQPATLALDVISAMDGALLQSGLDLGQYLSTQITAEVNFVALLEAIQSRCDQLIEVGPGSVLSGLAAATLGEKGVGALPVASRPERDQDLNTVLAKAFVGGVNVRWATLYAERLVRPFVPAAERLFIDNPCERPLVLGTADLSGIKVTATPTRRAPAVARQLTAPSSAQPTATPAANGAGTIEALLLEMAQQQTGFPVEAIPLNSRLLDDLNLDSIKASAYIAGVSSRLGVPNALDPARFANATLDEIAQALQTQLGEAATAPQRAPVALAAGAKPFDWVRNYGVHYVPEPAAAAAVNWSACKVMVIAEPSDHGGATALCEQVRGAGASVQMSSYKLLFHHDTQIDPTVTHWLAILPRKQARQDSLAQQLLFTMERLRAPAIPSVPTADGQKPCVAYVQFGAVHAPIPERAQQGNGDLAAGFARTLHHERPDLRVRLIDFAPDVAADALGACVLQELGGEAGFSMASYDAALTRYVPEVRLQQPARYHSRPLTWSSEDVLLATGGAKGITAECVLALARRTGVKLALVGSSAAPSPDDTNSPIAQTLQRCRAAGITARYYICNITDAAAVQALVATVQHDLGPVRGVVHGAGVNHPRLIQQVSLADALAEVSPKLLGAANLFAALEKAPPQLFVAFTSIIGVTGMPGNAWYAFSNETLAQMLRRFSADHAATTGVAVAYSVWDEVGMGARMGSVERLEQMGIGAIPVEEGVKRFLQLVTGDAGTDEVIVTARLGGLDTWPTRPPIAAADFRFIETVGQLEPGVMLQAQAHLTLARDLYVRDHIYQGAHLFPTVFGLEAMAQAAAYVTGERNPEIIRIEGIMLERPIIVDPVAGATIGLVATVEEENAAGERAVRVQIGTAHTGFVEPHFAATLILGQPPCAPQESVPLDAPLDIEPPRDLYGDLLFQGPLFQRMGPIRTLNDKFCVLHSHVLPPSALPELGFPAGQGTHIVLGDAVARDLLLQSIQLIIPQDRCLPIGIACIERFAAPDGATNQRIVIPKLIEKIDRDYICEVVTTTEEGFVTEKLTGYRVRVLETRPDYPDAGELAAPGRRDEQTFARTVDAALQQLGIERVARPVVALAHLPDLQAQSVEQRHVLAQPTVDRLLQTLLGAATNSLHFAIESAPSGKPLLRGELVRDHELSLAHDDNYLLCSIGHTPQGCDIETVQPRERTIWEAMLGTRSKFLATLMQQGDQLDLAATRLWCAMEATYKVDHKAESAFTVVKRHGQTVLLQTETAAGPILLLTFPVELTRKPTRMVAIALPATAVTLPTSAATTAGVLSHSVQPQHGQMNNYYQNGGHQNAQTQANGHQANSHQSSAHPVNGHQPNEQQTNGHVQNGHAGDHRLRSQAAQAMIARMANPDVHRVRLTHDGPEGQAVYELRFQASFKDAASLSRKIYFSQFISWIGKVRELPMKEIAPDLLRDFLTGEWGMVTNSTSLRIVGEATSYDTIQARVWVGEVIDASFVTRIEFAKVLDDQSVAVIAHGEVWATWVRLVRYGVPSPRPFPGYIDDYLTIFAAPQPETHREEAQITGISTLDLGSELYRKPAGLSLGPIIGTQTFQTTLEEANLVGNVYYGNYFIWQGRVRDLFLYSVAPHYLRDSKVQCEMLCLYTRMDYLREAMPFDRVRAIAAVESVAACGAVLNFEFYRENLDGSLEKLSVGRQEIAWVKRDAENQPIPMPWPPAVLQSLVAEPVPDKGQSSTLLEKAEL